MCPLPFISIIKVHLPMNACYSGPSLIQSVHPPEETGCVFAMLLVFSCRWGRRQPVPLCVVVDLIFSDLWS
jgi:hypothetical protein